MTTFKKSQAQIKIEKTVKDLQAKEKKQGLTVGEIKRLANALLKLENKSASRVYKNLKSPENKDIKKLVKQLLGGSAMPSFADFSKALPKRPSYSNWIGLNTLAKFNKKAAAATKADKQQDTQNAATATITNQATQSQAA